MRCRLRSSVALLALTATAHAEPVAVEAGAAHLTLATPAGETGYAATVSLGVGVSVRPDLDAILRGRVTFGGGNLATIGPQLQHRFAPLFVGYGVVVARVVGAAVEEPALRASGLGLGAELRVGVRFSDVAITAHALPIWVFASDSFQSEMSLDGALELGVTLGYQR
jgi:hypothetical protein